MIRGQHWNRWVYVLKNILKHVIPKIKKKYYQFLNTCNLPQICGITQLQTWDQHESICWITTLLDIVNLFHFLFDKLTRRILPIVHGPSSFTFYADQGLSPPHPPFQFVSDVKINTCWSVIRNLEDFLYFWLSDTVYT